MSILNEIGMLFEEIGNSIECAITGADAKLSYWWGRADEPITVEQQEKIRELFDKMDAKASGEWDIYNNCRMSPSTKNAETILKLIWRSLESYHGKSADEAFDKLVKITIPQWEDFIVYIKDAMQDNEPDVKMISVNANGDYFKIKETRRSTGELLQVISKVLNDSSEECVKKVFAVISRAGAITIFYPLIPTNKIIKIFGEDAANKINSILNGSEPNPTGKTFDEAVTNPINGVVDRDTLNKTPLVTPMA